MKNKPHSHGYYHARKEMYRKRHAEKCKNDVKIIISRNNYLKMHGIPKRRFGSRILRMIIDDDFIYYFNKDHSFEYKTPNNAKWQRRLSEEVSV